MELKVGKRYRLRNGTVIEVASITVPKQYYPVLSFDISDGMSHSHTLTGKAYIGNNEHEEDIIAEARKPREYWLGMFSHEHHPSELYLTKPPALRYKNGCCETIIHVREVLPGEE